MTPYLADNFKKSLKKREKEMSSFDKALTPEAFWYTEPSFFAFEKETIFYRLLLTSNLLYLLRKNLKNQDQYLLEL